MTLEDDLRRSLRLAKPKQRDTVKLRAIRSLVNDWEIKKAAVARATGLSPETIRMIAEAEGPYRDLPDLGPERRRWLSEWMGGYVTKHGMHVPIENVIKDALEFLPRVVKDRDKTRRASVA